MFIILILPYCLIEIVMRTEKRVVTYYFLLNIYYLTKYFNFQNETSQAKDKHY